MTCIQDERVYVFWATGNQRQLECESIVECFAVIFVNNQVLMQMLEIQQVCCESSSMRTLHIRYTTEALGCYVAVVFKGLFLQTACKIVFYSTRNQKIKIISPPSDLTQFKP